jgi:hypothetical protein
VRRWLSAVGAAVFVVAGRPATWLPGAVAWTVTVGWLAFVIGVIEPPTTAELTFLGARIFTSGAWPWNAIGIGASLAAAVAAAFGVFALAETVLLRGRVGTGPELARVVAIGLVCATPALIMALVVVLGIGTLAPVEFNSPDATVGPVVRLLGRLAPFLIGLAVLAMAGAAIHAPAVRRTLQGRQVSAALREAPGRLGRSGLGALVQPIAVLVVRLAYIGLAATLVRALWAPIGERLASDGIDLAASLLLLGFVAIWLCLVLGGGALHACGSLSWTRVLEAPERDPGRPDERMETRGRT